MQLKTHSDSLVLDRPRLSPSFWETEPTHRNIEVPSGTENGSSEKNRFWFHKEPFKPGFFKEPFPQRVLQKTYKDVSRTLKNGSLRHYCWFHK